MSSKTIDLSQVSRVSFALDFPFTATKVGTENCEVHFRMTREQERIVRAHFHTPSNRPIQFATCEISEQGNGWYLAFSMSERPDQAFKAILNIKAALWLTQNAKVVQRVVAFNKVKTVAVQTVAHAKPKRIVIVKRVLDDAGRLVSKACDRSLQALSNPEGYGLGKYRTEKIRNLMCANDLSMAVSNLRSHFQAG